MSSPDKIRSFTLLGSSGSGKTSLAESILLTTKITNRLGRVDEGTSLLHHDPEEIRRKMTLSSKIQSFPWQDYKVFFADTPGFSDFIGETIAPLTVLDAVVLVVDATIGVDVTTRSHFQLAVKNKKPILIFLSKMDKENANFAIALESIRTKLGKHAYPIVQPMGEGGGFKGILDLVDGRCFLKEGDKIQTGSIPKEQEDAFLKAQKLLIEEIAETDEALFERLANGELLKKEEVLPRLIEDIEDEEILPVLVGSSMSGLGVELLLDTLTHLVLPPDKMPAVEGENPNNQDKEARQPSPTEACAAQVFKIISDPGIGDLFFLRNFSGTFRHGFDLFNSRHKTEERMGHLFTFQGKERKEVQEVTVGEVVAVAKLKGTMVGDTLCDPNRSIVLPKIDFPSPVLSMSLKPKTKQDQEKLGLALGKIAASDPTFHFYIDRESSETVVSGMGEVHIETIVERLKNKFGIEITLGQPHIPYRETVTQKVRVQGKYKKQSGGHGQYGDVWITLEPRPLGSGFEFVDEIKGGVIPSKYIPAVETGVQEAMQKGVLAGYPVLDVKVTLVDGSFHSVDSSDLAFQIAGSMAFKKAEEEAKPIILEPIMKMEIRIPTDFVGSITNDLNSRRGKVMGMDQEEGLQVIRAEVPMSEVFKYATDLRSLTHGAGVHQMEFARYEPLPAHLMSKIEKK